MADLAELGSMVWNAPWIWSEEFGDPRYSVRYFRRSFDLDDPGQARLVLHMSADSRYRLCFNGRLVGRGPAKGDFEYYNFETYDLSERLVAGTNVLAVQVMSYGVYGPVSEIHGRHGALVVQGGLQIGKEFISLDTDPQWRVEIDTAYSPLYYHLPYTGGFYAINPQERFDGRHYPWGWEQADFDDSSWSPARAIARACGRSQGGHPRYEWRLSPREVAHLAEEPFLAEDMLDGPLADDMRKLIAPDSRHEFTIAAGSEVECTVYTGKLFTGYPALAVSGGAGSEVKFIYAEALKRDGRKSRRDDLSWGEVELDNPHDLFLPGGADNETWRPFWFRSARFIRIQIRTADQPLTIKALRFDFTSYPFKERGSFESDDPQLKEIWDVAWHTALCCAHEHYEDCPSYEQFQYVSDTRLQILISYYVAGDDTLARAAILAFDRSRLPDGITQSRYPSNYHQVIPTFSLLYVLMVEDHWVHYGDLDFLFRVAPGIGPIMHWFERHMNDDGLVGFVPWWVFVDWCHPQFDEGVPPEARTGPCAVVNLMCVASLDSAARLYHVAGDHHHAEVYRKRAEAMRQAIRKAMWNEEQGLFVDGPGSGNLSQHSNLWAILTDTATPEQSERIMQRLLDDPKLTRTTYIHDYYLFQALLKVGAIDRLEDVIGRWRRMIDYGFSTFPEQGEPTRSDCHAWSSWPMFEFQRVLLGVRPAEPGYASVLIAPRPFCGVTAARGRVPTCRGNVEVAWKSDGQRFALKARLPEAVAGRIELPDGTATAVTGGPETIVLGDNKLATQVTLKQDCC
ncbi:MAG: family 78 glycoside hydrolase catalytic domain [Anaerolineaceae bacterium]|nr:family 78 glycoside hydrolase catalytic domain [Anaerolineaceae bacterium]